MKYRQIIADYFCGIDLHSRRCTLCVMDKTGSILLRRNVLNNFNHIKQLIEPFLPSVAIGCESTYSYYWLADGCREADINFYLGHAIYMKAIAANKNKNDKIDARTIADLLRTSYFPEAYPYPKQMRATRDLLRRRKRLVSIRGEASAHIRMLAHQYALAEELDEIIGKRQHRYELIAAFDHDDIAESIEADLALSDAITPLVDRVEKQIIRQAIHHRHADFAALKSIPGVGDILALIILYETHDIARFKTVQQYSSYARVVRSHRSSNGKLLGHKNSKAGNPYLKWAFNEIVLFAKQRSEAICNYHDRLVSKKGKAKAKSIIGHKFAVAVYFMLKRGEVFDEKQFLGIN